MSQKTWRTVGLLAAQSVATVATSWAATPPPVSPDTAVTAPAVPGAAPEWAPPPGALSKPQEVPKPARLPDDKPNWTGFWTPRGGLMDMNFGPGAKPLPPRPPGVQGMPPATNSPLKSPYKEKYDGLRKAASDGVVAYDPNGLCLPQGMPGMMSGFYGLEILQTPGQVTITSEAGMFSRRIWTDGRAHPPLDELLPTYAGHSIGHWEGDVLVVDTIGVRDDVRIDQSGLPLSDQMHMTERLSSSEPGILIDEITLDDPKAYTAPWKQVRRYRFRPELSLQEYVCQENNRNVGPSGEPVFR